MTRVAKTMYLPDGTAVVVRPICEADAERLARMFDRLSPTTVYRRFFSPITRPRPSALRHLATVDHVRREALVALDGDEIVAVARYDTSRIDRQAEIAVTVEDAWQRRGLGSLLLQMLTKQARERGFDQFFASMLADNRPALSLLHHLVPEASVSLDGGAYEATINLTRDLELTSATQRRTVRQAVNEAQA
jgi:GNAT superfamily N-acetyltransferase